MAYPGHDPRSGRPTSAPGPRPPTTPYPPSGPYPPAAPRLTGPPPTATGRPAGPAAPRTVTAPPHPPTPRSPTPYPPTAYPPTAPGRGAPVPPHPYPGPPPGYPRPASGPAGAAPPGWDPLGPAGPGLPPAGPPPRQGRGGLVAIVLAVVVVLVLGIGGIVGWNLLSGSSNGVFGGADTPSGSGDASDRSAISAQLHGYVNDLKRGDWHGAAGRICAGTPTRALIEGMAGFMQGNAVDDASFGIVIDEINVHGSTADLTARYTSAGETTAPLPGQASKDGGSWCLVA